ncbi:Sensor protein ZraS [Planctomycetes bacterium Pan216]|uniref:histidine kinase n=1 Tax=Kolteria novifilia TaxID=2527975 RepID=A0A518B677_9BACT|nr:Sensor protein ZraS [Planctomycetes bacterium Pan216]
MARKTEDGHEQLGALIPKEQLEQLQRQANIGAVASSVAHEFNNILMTILNFAKIGARSKDPEVVNRSFDKILSASRRAAKITTGVLALAKNRSALKETSDVASLIEEVLSVVEKDLVKHRVHLKCEFGSRPTAEVVPSQIEQVLLNLIINARQAMDRGGDMTISLRHNQRSDMVEIAIKDSGVGIPPDQLQKIFEPFFSTKDGPDETGRGGSGLGLSICREIIERHHGRIRVESRVGRGTTFTLKLPRVAVDNGAQAA